MNPKKNSLIRGREIEFFHHGTDSSWGYAEERQDSFAVVHPKNEISGKKYPLTVVFHSAGHNMYSALECTFHEGNHDIYHTPDDSFALFVDCFENSDSDWWWGGMSPLGEIDEKRCGTDPQPVEKRIIDTVLWVRENYPIDENRVYAVGNSMGGTGALGICFCRGDIFAAIKVNVPAGVRHIGERCCFGDNVPDGFKIPDPPITVDYSAQNDVWSTGHELLYESVKRRRYALMGYWGNFGHENNNKRMYEFNDLIHSFDIFSVRKNEAYPAFTDTSTDDVIPWGNDINNEASGQVNSFFKWKTVSDTENCLTVSLRLMNENDFTTRVTLPRECVTNVTVRRCRQFKADGGIVCTYDGKEIPAFVFDGCPAVDGITVTRDEKLLTFSKIV